MTKDMFLAFCLIIALTIFGLCFGEWKDHEKIRLENANNEDAYFYVKHGYERPGSERAKYREEQERQERENR